MLWWCWHRFKHSCLLNQIILNRRICGEWIKYSQTQSLLRSSVNIIISHTSKVRALNFATWSFPHICAADENDTSDDADCWEEVCYCIIFLTDRFFLVLDEMGKKYRHTLLKSPNSVLETRISNKHGNRLFLFGSLSCCTKPITNHITTCKNPFRTP